MSVLDKVAALLAKAESTTNEAEADAYVNKAQQLATRHEIDVELARAHRRTKSQGSVPVQKVIAVGTPGKHVNKQLVALFVEIADANDVRVDVARNSSYVIAFGLGDDIELCETLWVHVAPTMVAAAKRFVAHGTWREETAYRTVNGQRVRVPLTAAGARAGFCQGFSNRVGQRLQAARATAIANADAEISEMPEVDGAGTQSAALVLARKSQVVGKFHQRESKARGSWRGYQGTAASSGSVSRRQGSAAGAKVRLSRQREVGTVAGELAG